MSRPMLRLAELIAHLTKLHAEHGNIDVIVEANIQVHGQFEPDDDNAIVLDASEDEHLMQAAISSVHVEYRCADEPAVHISIFEPCAEDFPAEPKP